MGLHSEVWCRISKGVSIFQLHGYCALMMFLFALTVFGISIASAAAVQLQKSMLQAEPSLPSSFPTGSFDQWSQNTSLFPASPSDGAWNSTFLEGLNVSANTGYRCDASRFGRDLSPSSCLSAWSFIPAVTTELSFGPRESNEQQYDVGLPRRYLSCKSPSWLSPTGCLNF